MLLVQNARVLGDILDVLCINNSIVKIGKIDYKLLRNIFFSFHTLHILL